MAIMPFRFRKDGITVECDSVEEFIEAVSALRRVDSVEKAEAKSLPSLDRLPSPSGVTGIQEIPALAPHQVEPKRLIVVKTTETLEAPKTSETPTEKARNKKAKELNERLMNILSLGPVSREEIEKVLDKKMIHVMKTLISWYKRNGLESPFYKADKDNWAARGVNPKPLAAAERILSPGSAYLINSRVMAQFPNSHGEEVRDPKDNRPYVCIFLCPDYSVWIALTTTKGKPCMMISKEEKKGSSYWEKRPSWIKGRATLWIAKNEQMLKVVKGYAEETGPLAVTDVALNRLQRAAVEHRKYWTAYATNLLLKKVKIQEKA
jgi:hypothetical protein